jgi:arginine N-succinyltransferase
MFIIRPIRKNDLDNLMNLLQESGHGLTSLPKDEKIIANKILISERSFEHRGERPNGESYLFVMEEVFTGKMVGISGIISKIGGFDPYYFYKLKTEKMSSKMLNVERDVQTLHMEKVHSGPAEICSLFLAPEYRNSQNGRFLSLSRFLFMAENEQYFEDTVIAEMRGQVNDEGHSPFWNAVGHKFMEIDFLHADYLTMKSKSFIEELLPNYPILIDLLPKDAQDVIAQVHEHTAPARRILEQEGFKFNGLVGIFEPGPVLEAEVKEIRAYKESNVVEIEEITADDFVSDTFIISTSGAGNKFKTALGKVEILDSGKVRIQAVVATALKFRLGDTLRYVTFRSTKPLNKNLEV